MNKKTDHLPVFFNIKSLYKDQHNLIQIINFKFDIVEIK